MQIYWEHFAETSINNEHAIALTTVGDKPIAAIIRFLEGWEVWLTLPGQNDVKTGECYKTERSARSAAKRALNKYAPLKRKDQ